MEPIEPTIESPPGTSASTTPNAATRPTAGIRRGLATAALAIGLLVVGGTAVVLAASPEPSITPAPATTTQPGADDSATDLDTRASDGTKPDCPDGADGRGPGRAGADGSTGNEPSADPDAADPSDTPSTAPSDDPTTQPSPTLDDSEV